MENYEYELNNRKKKKRKIKEKLVGKRRDWR